MKKILIITPHFPPSNLAAVHRSRLFSQHLPSFGWKPIILTVDEKYYEEELDQNLASLLPADLQIEKVKALRVTKPRLVGDIGLRALFPLYKRAKQLIREYEIDFVYIPIPSFYTALIGRWLHASTKVKYGIDYIDPWVHTTPRGKKLFSRHWFSEKLALLLEPYAVKKAALITGVAEGYYKQVFERNPHLKKQAVRSGMPYGGELNDHRAVKSLTLRPYLFNKNPGKLQLVYAGAMLPKAYAPLEQIFKAIKSNPGLFKDLEIHFIGTGKSPDDPVGFNIKPLAQQYSLWETTVYEYPRRIAYMDVLVHLDAADGVFILGSTEPHYTPSKVYQGVLSAKALLAVLHKESTAVNVIEQSETGRVLAFNGEQELDLIREKFPEVYKSYLQYLAGYDYANINLEIFEQYSAKSVTAQLVQLLNEVVPEKAQIISEPILT